MAKSNAKKTTIKKAISSIKKAPQQKSKRLKREILEDMQRADRENDFVRYSSYEEFQEELKKIQKEAIQN
jgi:excinuclease UvrABC nuclease subunit